MVSRNCRPVVETLKACPNAKITVVGHTDSTGTDAINNPLSQNRAKSVAAYLVSQGVAADAVQQGRRIVATDRHQ